jgi:hypothetical protein
VEIISGARVRVEHFCVQPDPFGSRHATRRSGLDPVYGKVRSTGRTILGGTNDTFARLGPRDP